MLNKELWYAHNTEIKMLKITLTIAAMTLATTVSAADTPISGTVESKCSIFTDIQGVYGNPNPYELSTTPADGGKQPIIRYDVASADFYTAKISYPTSFSSSPSLSDTVTWTGDVEVSSVSDTNMSGYEAAKVQYDNVTEFDLTVAGTTWFKVTSNAQYGYQKSFPAGNYTAIATAECIAN